MTEEKNWFVDVWQEWSQILEDCNWYTFTFCRIEFENDKIMGAYEVMVIILGLGFRWRWNHTRTKEMQGLVDQVAEIRAGTAKTRPLSEFTQELREEGLLPPKDSVH